MNLRTAHRSLRSVAVVLATILAALAGCGSSSTRQVILFVAQLTDPVP